MSDLKTELYRTHTAGQERRAYFLIAAAGASIAFAVTRTQDAVWVPSIWIWCGAIVCWALSFYFGLRHMSYVGSATYANMDLLEANQLIQQELGRVSAEVYAMRDGIRSAIERNSNRSALHARLQFAFLVAGGAFFLAWHIYEIYLRSA